jgi:protein-glutamine gamma-glutamyltransferase
VSAPGQVAVLAPAPLRGVGQRVDAAASEPRPGVRLATFAALGLYGVLRWSNLQTPAPTWRLLGLLALAVALAACGPVLGERGRPLTAVAAVAAGLAIFPLSGVPLTWVTHLRVAATANGIGDGVSAMPRSVVPYNGVDDWIRVVNLLAASVLMLSAGLVLASVERVSDLRRAAAAVPLIAVAIVPMTIVRPRAPYVDGLVLFGLVAAFIWGERLRRRDVGRMLAVCAVAGAGAVVVAPLLDPHSPWINYQALASDLSSGHVEQFDWSQRYGPLIWPRTGHEVLDVRAQRPDYWKAENLDVFDGQGWSAGTVDSSYPPPAPDASALARWTQTLTVTLRAMSTSDVLAAGYALQTTNMPAAVVPGLSPGTWIAGTALGPGDSYNVRAYTPDPSAAELTSAGQAFPTASLSGYMSLTMPQPSNFSAQQVLFTPFGSHQPPVDVSDPVDFTGTSAVMASPYASAYRLATRLATHARTPYAYVASVERYLSRGYTYSESPPTSSYPLETFLFTDRIGYCQQFAGAMALLLRMGGVPARVAAGFTAGGYDTSTRTWVVSDIDAHAWVEAWFPHYGWVRFDPTPAAAPARGGHVAVAPIHDTPSPAALARLPGARRDVAPLPPGQRSAAKVGGGSAALPIAIFAALLAVAGGAALLTRRTAEPTDDELLAELERALARSGRPITAGVTLAGLEHRFRSSPEAATYIREIRLGRFGGRDERPTLRGRRALRAQLRAGLGLGGGLRALWALPPRWRL